MKHKTPRDRVMEIVNSIPDGRFYESHKGVPLAIVGDKSVCWFGKQNMYRVFHGWMQPGKQLRFDFTSLDEVKKHLEAESPIQAGQSMLA